MDKSQVEAIVNREIEALANAMGLSEWTIVVDLGRIDGAQPGCIGHADCLRLPDYERAEIGIDHDEQVDESHLLKNLRHELFHVVLSPFDILHRYFVQGLEGEELRKAEAVWHQATERGVRNLERLWKSAEGHWREVIAEGKAGEVTPC